MKRSVLCFGEVLWDCLPSGRVLGGAPLNVAYHAAKLGARAAVVSAVGDDDLGREAAARIAAGGVSTEHLGTNGRLPTGTVEVSLSAGGQPTFTIACPVAWDEIPLGSAAIEAAAAADAVAFGSLAARSEGNRRALDELLHLPGPRKVFDVNLRPPFDEAGRALDLARSADIVKLNDAELVRLSGMPASATGGPDGLRPALGALERLVGPRVLCVTCGAEGAVLWREGELWSATAPRVQVADTVGAGDAFTAALTLALLEGGTPRVIQAGLDDACALGALVASLPGAQPPYDPRALGLRSTAFAHLRGAGR